MAGFFLHAAFDNAAVNAENEVYQDTLHGWCPPDSRDDNKAQAERASDRLLLCSSVNWHRYSFFDTNLVYPSKTHPVAATYCAFYTLPIVDSATCWLPS